MRKNTYQTILSIIAWIGSVQIFMQYVLGLVSGRLMDTERLRTVSIGGSLLSLFSLFMLSLTQRQQYYQILLAQAIGYVSHWEWCSCPPSGLSPNHFTRRRSLAMGIIPTANSFGGFVFSVMFSHLFRGRVGFAMGIRIGGFICLGCLSLAQVLMHQYPKGKLPNEASLSIPASSPSTVAAICKNQPYVLTVLGGFVFNLGLFYPIFNVQLFAREEGFAPTNLIGWFLGIIDLSSCVGRVVLTYLGDRYGPVRTIAPCALISGVLPMTMFLWKGSAAIVAFCVLYGVFSGGVFALLCPAVFSWDSDRRTSGLGLGIACVPFGIASLVGAPLSTALAHVGSGSRTWYAGCIFAGVMEVLAAVLFLVAIFRNNKLQISTW
ncbi:MFS general substrate transporter [Pterulicium gracile]|uniref:MFS general substrate transporter n=1 Tax=Pterulicium gracile TaxID=1884261 RepID=A0A5C3QCP7_9AGAR|nr:MFS general substrate transporter [Pterula gracilis]